MALIEIKNISKIYSMGEIKVEALKNVSLEIERGDFVAIMGPSGSGKSTLTQILGLLDTPTSGSYRLNSHEVARLSEDELALIRRREIGFIFQQFHLLPRMTASQNVGLPLLYSQLGNPSERAEKLLNQVGLGTRTAHHTNELSGGQQQRVAIARSLVNTPELVIADEPTGNLDSTSEKEIMRILHDLNARGITVIIVTHEEEIGLQAKRLIRMRDGVIQSDERKVPLGKILSTPRQTTTEPENLFKEILVHFAQGFQTLAANKVRTALSVLGILIGVAAVVAVLALGRGAQLYIEKELSSLGSNLLVLRAGAMRVGGVLQQSGATALLNPQDAKLLLERFPSVRTASPTVNGRVQATYLNKNWNSQVLGAPFNYGPTRNYQPQVGRFFTEEESRMRSRLAVVGRTVVRELFGNRNPIGEMIKLNRINFQVIGVYQEKGSNGFQDQDDQILVPLETAMYRLLGKESVDTIELQMADNVDLDAIQEQIIRVMTEHHRIPTSQQDEAFRIRSLADIQKALTQSSQTMTMLLSAVAAISLLVGGIGIMNIMLVSVTERTKEIGLRKAIGARRRDILMQFLAESVVVSLVGGLAGILLGSFITLAIGRLTGWSVSISLQSVALSFLFSATIGIIFGIYPARKASRLSPIQALRYE